MMETVFAAGVAWLAAKVFGLPPLLTVVLTILIARAGRSPATGPLWRNPAIRLAVLMLLFLWLVGNWSAYRHGVSAGYEAVAGATPTP